MGKDSSKEQSMNNDLECGIASVIEETTEHNVGPEVTHM